MLEIKNIRKIYETADLKQTALDNVSINFRKCEFTCILGPSGSGKTTLLNIIGGLDRYDEGDLIINNVSTKKYNDRSWDSYRNHRIGFVFQSYNLISHQTVLNNVELALTLSGVSKSERTNKAKKVLKEVGLENHINKKPNQLSGGQMQRVAIARALINDPDILLADEPTGALDSETSKQIMKILKKVSNNKLVIMVTHNSELANEYSTRIVELKDGKIVSDSNPYTEENNMKEETKKTKKTSMSFLTALSLSFNNLMVKKKRTILVAFASSIGIIGIALILALSTGFQNYIDKIQEDTLSSYPLTITSETADMTSLLLSMVSEKGVNDNTNTVKEKQYITSIFSNIKSNDLKSFKGYLEKKYQEIENDISSIKYTYSITPHIYTIDASQKLVKLNPSSLMSSIYSSSVTTMTSSFSSIFSQMIDDHKMLEEQYDLLSGKWPNEYNEVIIVLSEPNSISDMLVYSLGLRDLEELNTIVTSIMTGETVTINNEPMEFSYDDLMNVNLKLIAQPDVYKYNDKYNIYEDMSEDNTYMQNLYDTAESLKIVGIVAPKEGTTSMALLPGVAYTSALTNHILTTTGNTDIVKKQLAYKEIDVFSNKRFDDDDSSQLNFENLITIDTKGIEKAFNIKVDENEIKNVTAKYMENITKSITTDTKPAYNSFLDNLTTLSNGLLNDYITTPLKQHENEPVIHLADVDLIVETYITKNKNILDDLEKNYVIPSSTFNQVYSGLLKGMLQGYIMSYYGTDPTLTTDETNPVAKITTLSIDTIIPSFTAGAVSLATAETMAKNMTEATMQKAILSDVGKLTEELMKKISNAFKIDEKTIASSFKININEEEMKRVVTAMISPNTTKNAMTNLITLGYQPKDEPTSISFYFTSFEAKQNFQNFIDTYNNKVEKEHSESIINYTDTTGILISSVKKVVDSVSYVLIAFVSISLLVSSIMIGIITYISVLERTKEIGILRAIGASKRNISSIFNAETFIIGLLSGSMGIIVSLILIIPINAIIHSLTNNTNISAILPYEGAIILIILSIILTIIGGLIPSKIASKKDPVVALRSE